MSWFEDDPELLRAALDILDTWSGDTHVSDISVASPCTDGTESSHSANDDSDDVFQASLELEDFLKTSVDALSTTAPKPVTSPHINKSPAVIKTRTQNGTRELKPSTVASTRHRRREEIIYLRDKVQELETQLAQLQQNKDDDSNSSVAKNGVDHALAVMWHDISSRQQKLRQKSELEHAKLRTLLETQVKVAQGLIKLMQKARRIEEDADFPRPKRSKYVHDVSAKLDNNVQLTRLGEQYAQLDQAFTFAKFHDGSTKFIDVNVDDREEEVVIEFREAWSVPFNEADVLNAVWLYTIKVNEDKACKPDFVGQVTVDGDLMISRFTSSTNIGTLKGTFNGTMMAKRYTGADGRRQAIVKSMAGRTVDGAPGFLAGINMTEDTRIRVMQLAPTLGLAADKPLTLVQTIYEFRLTFDDDISPAHRRQAGVMTDFLLEHLHEDIELKHVTVETLLLQARSNA